MTIQEWFKKGCDFDLGAKLLHQRGSDAQLFTPYIGQRFIPDWVKCRLQTELNNLPMVSGQRTMDNMPQPIEPIISPITHHPPPTNDDEPPIIKQYRRKWYDNTNAYRRTHALMCASLNQTERAELAKQIMTAIVPERKEIGQVLENWKINKALPKTTDTPVSDIDYTQGLRDGAAKMQRIANLTSRINRIEKQLIPLEKDTIRLEKLKKESLEKQSEITTIKTELGI